MRSKAKDRRMLRTLDGMVLAFLDGRYRVLDNEDVMDAAIPVLRPLPSKLRWLPPSRRRRPPLLK